MARPFTRAQALQNQAFLAALRQTGNARAAAQALGVHRATYTKRRNAHPAFAAQWDAALALASADLAAVDPRIAARAEPQFVRLASGRLQLRTRPAGRLSKAAEQAFLTALAATANIRLSARAAGFTHAAFYHRARTHAGFAREMRLALQTGYDRLELALLASNAPASHEDDHWRHNDPPPVPPMTFDQVMQLLRLHQKQVRLQSEPAHIRRRRGESREAHSFRLAAMYREGQRREREAFDIAEAERRADGRPSPFAPPPPILPALDQVTGWSAATSRAGRRDEE